MSLGFLHKRVCNRRAVTRKSARRKHVRNGPKVVFALYIFGGPKKACFWQVCEIAVTAVTPPTGVGQVPTTTGFVAVTAVTEAAVTAVGTNQMRSLATHPSCVRGCRERGDNLLFRGFLSLKRTTSFWGFSSSVATKPVTQRED